MVPTPAYFTDRFGDVVAWAVQHFRAQGIDPALMDGIAAWAKTVWPNGTF